MHAPLERRSDGKLWSFTSVGSYTLVYLTRDHEVLCPDCANGENGSEACEGHEEAQWDLVGCDVYWEGPPVQCAHCGCDIESSYGDPEEG